MKGGAGGTVEDGGDDAVEGGVGGVMEKKKNF